MQVKNLEFITVTDAETSKLAEIRTCMELFSSEMVSP